MGKTLDHIGYAIVCLAIVAVIVGTNNSISNALTTLFQGLTSWVSNAMASNATPSNNPSPSAAPASGSNGNGSNGNGTVNNPQTVIAPLPMFLQFSNPLAAFQQFGNITPAQSGATPSPGSSGSTPNS